MIINGFTKEKPPRIPVAELKSQLLNCLIEAKEKYNVSKLSSKFKKDRAQIYRLLKQLEDEHLIYSEKDQTKNRKNKKRNEEKIFFAKKLPASSGS